jgi:hypothetical protein
MRGNVAVLTNFTFRVGQGKVDTEKCYLCKTGIQMISGDKRLVPIRKTQVKYFSNYSKLLIKLTKGIH